MYIVEAHGRASISTLNRSGCNRTKGTAEREGEETPMAELKSKIEADLDKQWVWGGTRGRTGCREQFSILFDCQTGRQS